jgi:hypothetical protein
MAPARSSVLNGVRIPAVLACAIALAAVPACSGGGGGGSSSAVVGSPSTSQPAGYVNPAWNQPVASPQRVWNANPGPDTFLASWFNSRPWLLDRSTWFSYMQNTQQPSREQLGAFGYGNGRVFGMSGMSYPLNTLHGVIGPVYQGGAGNMMGDFAIGADIGPRGIAFAEEWAWKPRRAAAVVTKSRSSELEVHTVDFAPPGTDAVIRVLVVRNPTAVVQPDVYVTGRILGGNTSEGNRLVQVKDNRNYTIGGQSAWGAATVLGDKIRVPIGYLQPGEERAAMIYVASTVQSDTTGRAALVAKCSTTPYDVFLEQTRQYWADFFSQCVTWELPDPKVQDFIEDMTATVAVQIAENGCASPMSRYTKTWMRDQEGALRVFLRQGRPELVKRMLESYYKTSIICGNSMPVDIDVRQAGAAPDWMQVSFMPGRIATEAPSYIPIELHDYYKATGDIAILQNEYEYLKAAVLRQEVSPEGLMRFNSDEPFRWVMMLALGLYEPENLGWSSNSMFLYTVAADRAAKIAALLGKQQDAAMLQQRSDFVRAATEKYMWLPTYGHYDVCLLDFGPFAGLKIPVAKPYEDISLLPMRIGYGDPKSGNVRQNLLTVKNLIGKANGLIHSNALLNGVHGTDGMVPGYYLENLTMIDHPDAELTFNAIGNLFALNTGEIAEGMWAGGQRGAAMLQYFPEGGDDVVARYRPWEGGLVADAVMRYLIGETWDAPNGRVSVTPHLPNGWGGLTARGLECGARPYDVEVRDFGARRVERVTNRGTQPLTVDLGASFTGFALGEVRVDGVAVQPSSVEAEFGRISFRVEKTLAPGAWIDLDFDYTR